MESWFLLVLLVKLVAGLEDYEEFSMTTNDQQVTITCNPGQDCLPYDGSEKTWSKHPQTSRTTRKTLDKVFIGKTF